MTVKAIHLICRRDESGGLKNLRYVSTDKTYRSGQWDVSVETARALVGGWIYLHPGKSAKSEFGGTILGFEQVVDDTLAHRNRIVFAVRKHVQGGGQRWRGRDDTMASSGGVVPADLPHETA